MKLKPKFQFKRRELKYLVSPGQHQQLRQFLHHLGLTPDKYTNRSTRRSYLVSSLYLDTPDYRFYWEKQHGIKDRIKFRLRTYSLPPDKNTLIYWEIKQKYQDFISKERLSLPWGITQQFLNQSISFAKLSRRIKDGTSLKTLSKFYFNTQKLRLKPVVLVNYQREPWLDPNFTLHSNFRLTFDYKITASPIKSFSKHSYYSSVLSDWVVLEIKFNGPIPKYVNKIVKSFNLSRQSISKYCLSLEACDIVSEENKK